MDKDALAAENRLLKQEIEACNEQGRLFKSLLEMVGSAPEKEMLRHTMQETLDITARLSGAKAGSIFVLDETGVVTDAILTREDADENMKARLLGTVLDRGLAGWVRTHLKAALISDTRTDNRWVTLPGEPYAARSVLSVPVLRESVLFGILTLIHPEPDFFEAADVDTVRVTAGHMALAIEGAQIYLRLEELNRQRRNALERDLTLARQVQESFLPSRMPEAEGYGFGALNRPALEVGGDFYYFYQLGGEQLGIAIGDVSGKGIAASLFMARLSSELAHFAPMFNDPGQLLAQVNDSLAARARQGMFVTMVYLVLDLASGRVAFANAGHLPPLCVSGAGVSRMGSEMAKGPPLGILADAAFESQSYVLTPGDTITLYTDGVIEARDRRGGMFGFERLVAVLQGSAGNGPDGMIAEIVRDVDRFSRDQGRGDDLTLVCVRRKSLR